MSDFLSFAITLAREAGAILLEGYRQPKQIEHKGEIDLVTEFDRRSEQLILSRIRAAYPAHAISAEESGRHAGGDYEWFVDPLDGTTNFAHGLPIFAVSIALARRGQLLAGVVYDPTRDELFAAEAGGGATLNGARLQVSNQRELGRALLVTGFPYDVRTNPHNNLAQFARFQLRSQAVRRLGSAALDCCYVAAGRFDAYWEFRVKAWDIAAGALLVQEAGGRVTTAQGDEGFLGRDSLLITNGHLHKAMVGVLREGANR
jgi:myo-inositol-1(or 4)-monophosphatase